jgi:hypothetical protein
MVLEGHLPPTCSLQSLHFHPPLYEHELQHACAEAKWLREEVKRLEQEIERLKARFARAVWKRHRTSRSIASTGSTVRIGHQPSCVSCELCQWHFASEQSIKPCAFFGVGIPSGQISALAVEPTGSVACCSNAFAWRSYAFSVLTWRVPGLVHHPKLYRA